MRAEPRSALARRTNSSALGVPAGDTRPSRRSRYSPASMPKNSAIPICAMATHYVLAGTRSTRSRGIDQRSHFAHRRADAGENAAADDAVADVELLNFRDRGDGLNVDIGESMPRVNGEAGLAAERRG